MIYSRQKLEERESHTLASYGFKSQDSRGREYPESEGPHRTSFQRDRDRILHTTAFRRLEYKTQVFVNTEGDYYRTRLTHTLEVAQLGRSLARTLGANEELTEAICLAHDLGHPPFGHSGEIILNRLMHPEGGFDHNKQSLRIVTELEERYPDFRGLNLTWEVREGIVKHETEYDLADSAHYHPELRGHLEAQIANAADELAYTAHDLDDGLRSGLLKPEALDGLGMWDMVKDSIGWTREDFDDLTRHRIIRRLIGMQIHDLTVTTEAAITASGAQNHLEIQQLGYNVVTWSNKVTTMNRELKDFLYEKLYRHFRVVRMAEKAEKFISQLYDVYIAEPYQLPPSARAQIELSGLERAVCDYIAGMTDRFALDEYAKLFDPHTRP